MSRLSYRLYAELTVNRALKDTEMISPGGYTISTNDGKSYTFDFVETEGYHDEDDATKLIIVCKNPDYSYEDTSDITKDILSNIATIDDFYVDLEGCEDDLKIMSLDTVSFDLINDNGDMEPIGIDESVIEECSDRMFGE